MITPATLFAEILALTAAAPPCGVPLFPAPQYEMDSSPAGMIAADLDGDGRVAIVVTQWSGVSVLRATPAGGFEMSEVVETGLGAEELDAADFNGDGHVDVAVAHALGTVAVLLNDGQGVLTLAGQYGVGLPAEAITAGDFDGDDVVDLAVTVPHEVNPTIALLFGKGDGTFRSATFLETDLFFYHLDAVDLDDDGDVDLVGLAWRDGDRFLTSLLNEGEGVFASPILLPTDRFRDMALEEMTGDEALDVVVSGLDAVAVYESQGDGTFVAHASAEVSNIGRLDVADLDRDGDLDVAVASGGCVDVGAECVAFLLNDGAGDLTGAGGVTVGEDIDHIIAADVTGDGWVDLIVGDGESSSVIVMPAAGALEFRTAELYDSPHGPRFAAIDDLDGDGNLDLAVVNFNIHTVSIILGLGDGAFGDIVNYGTASNPSAVSTADLDGDGNVDLAVSYDGGAGGVSVFLGAGDGSFGARRDFLVPGLARALDVADVNGDGIPDIAATSWNMDLVTVLVGIGDGTYETPLSFATEAGPVTVAIAEMSGDDRPDLVVGNYWGESVSVLRGNGDGTFEAAVNYRSGRGGGPQTLAVYDLDGDGHADVVAANYDTSRSQTNIAVLLNDQEGGLDPAVSYSGGAGVHGSAIGDLDGDGAPDIVVANLISSNISVLRGVGDGTFRPAEHFALPGTGRVCVADLDNDGDNDLLSVRPIAFLRNNSCPFADVNGDGVVSFADVMAILVAWGPCSDPPASCPEDLDRNGVVGTGDLLLVVEHWS